ncbi:hypothetical protein OQA88_7669 [Cercophora sp. LCS_1]
MTQASANSEPLSSSESTAAQTIAFGVVTSVAALVALYLSYKQLRIMRSRRSRPPTPGDPEDVFPSGVITDAYPLYPLQHRGAGAGYAQEAPGDSGYLLHITRSQTIHQYGDRPDARPALRRRDLGSMTHGSPDPASRGL